MLNAVLRKVTIMRVGKDGREATEDILQAPPTLVEVTAGQTGLALLRAPSASILERGDLGGPPFVTFSFRVATCNQRRRRCAPLERCNSTTESSFQADWSHPPSGFLLLSPVELSSFPRLSNLATHLYFSPQAKRCDRGHRSKLRKLCRALCGVRHFRSPLSTCKIG